MDDNTSPDRLAAFRELVKKMRKARHYSRGGLANLARVSDKWLAEMENGATDTVTHLHVRALANALELKGFLWDELFLAARLDPETRPSTNLSEYVIDSLIVNTFIEDHGCPILIADPIYDMHSANAWAAKIYNVTIEEASQIMIKSCGGNLLAYLFGVYYEQTRATVQSRNQWDRLAYRFLTDFRIRSRAWKDKDPYKERYKILMDWLNEKPHFRTVWDKLESPNTSRPDIGRLSQKVTFQYDGVNLRFSVTGFTNVANFPRQLVDWLIMIYRPVDAATFAWTQQLATAKDRNTIYRIDPSLGIGFTEWRLGTKSE